MYQHFYKLDEIGIQNVELLLVHGMKNPSEDLREYFTLPFHFSIDSGTVKL